MYRFYQDIKEEEQETEALREMFRVGDSNKFGPFKIDTDKYHTVGFCRNGLPCGLVIVFDKHTQTKMYCSFSDEGLPNGEWKLYNNRGNLIKSKKYFF